MEFLALHLALAGIEKEKLNVSRSIVSWTFWAGLDLSPLLMAVIEVYESEDDAYVQYFVNEILGEEV